MAEPITQQAGQLVRGAGGIYISRQIGTVQVQAEPVGAAECDPFAVIKHRVRAARRAVGSQELDRRGNRLCRGGVLVLGLGFDGCGSSEGTG